MDRNDTQPKYNCPVCGSQCDRDHRYDLTMRLRWCWDCPECGWDDQTDPDWYAQNGKGPSEWGRYRGLRKR